MPDNSNSPAGSFDFDFVSQLFGAPLGQQNGPQIQGSSLKAPSIQNAFNSASYDGFSVGDLRADTASVKDVYSGKADAEDWGGLVGTGVGAYFGQPGIGNIVGRKVLPWIRSLF